MEQRAGGLTEDWLSVWIGLAVFVLAFGVRKAARVMMA